MDVVIFPKWEKNSGPPILFAPPKDDDEVVFNFSWEIQVSSVKHEEKKQMHKHIHVGRLTICVWLRSWFPWIVLGCHKEKFRGGPKGG